MADKSQRNQFKKKVTTCPLLLSLFLLGSANAAKTTTATPVAQYNVGMNPDLLVTTASVGFWTVVAPASTTTEHAATTAAGASATAAGCLAACVAKAADGDHTACLWTQTFTQAALAAPVYTSTCQHWTSATSADATFQHPWVHASPVDRTYTTGWAWKTTADAGANPRLATAFASMADVQGLIGKPRVRQVKADTTANAETTAASGPTGLYAAIGHKYEAAVEYATAGRIQNPELASTGIFKNMDDLIGKPEKAGSWTAANTFAANTPATGLYLHIGGPAKEATGNTLTSHKNKIEASGLFKAIGAPAVAQKYAGASGDTKVYGVGSDATGLYARIGEPGAAAAATQAQNSLAAIETSGLFKSIGTPSVVGTTLFSAIGAPVIPGEPVGATQASGGSSAKKDEVKSTGLYKHIGDAAAAASAYVPASAAGVTPVVAQANAKNAVVASGLYKSIADKAVTSCPTEAQIKEVIKTTEPKAPADGAEARFAATLLASAAALAALV